MIFLPFPWKGSNNYLKRYKCIW